GERSDCTAEFLAYLPISKPQRLVAKLSLIVLTAAVVWGLNWGIIGSFHQPTEPYEPNAQQLLEPAKYIALMSFAAFGVAWFVSSIQSSPTFAVTAGVITPILFLITFVMIDLNFHLKPGVLEQFYEIGLPILCLTSGTLGFGGGTWYFLKRVEP
ncbi:MAG: hypothetical protein KDA84_25260, partial [Planctomycetaceae bacterium]|nr:hypothetical protein [Planctomycetaceae bacterium]